MPSVADVSRPEWDRSPVTSSGNPRVSIIVPARNEEAEIENALRSLLALDYDNYEVIAVNDRSTDRTGEIMERVAGSPHPSKIVKRASHPTIKVKVPASPKIREKWGTHCASFITPNACRMAREDSCHVDCGQSG